MNTSSSGETGLGMPAPEAITPEWLNECLASSNVGSGEIVAFHAKPIGTGQLARTFRLTLTYSKTANAQPQTIVCKCSSEDRTSLATGSSGLYQAEVGFYKDLANQLTINTPQCYYADIDSTGTEFLLLLEDLSTAAPGNQLLGCDPQVAQTAVLEVAGLHAPTWRHTEFTKLSWMNANAGPDRIVFMHELFRKNLAGFLERYAKELDNWIVDIFEEAAQTVSYPAIVQSSEAMCLTHGDFRLDNLMIEQENDSAIVHTVDWQTIALGNPLSDVALFLGGGLLPEVRSDHEQKILKAYHQRLLSLGISDYGWDECWADYRLATFCGFMTAVTASMMAARSPRGDELFTTMARRHALHVRELDAMELLR